MAGYLLSDAARRQIDDILFDSATSFGSDAARRYALLITTSLELIGANPDLAGSVEVKRLPGVRAYALRLSRLKIDARLRVGAPRHLVIYGTRNEGAALVFGLVHDRMVLSRAARKLVPSPQDP